MYQIAPNFKQQSIYIAFYGFFNLSTNKIPLLILWYQFWARKKLQLNHVRLALVRQVMFQIFAELVELVTGETWGCGFSLSIGYSTSWRWICNGVLLAFARTIGETGTVFVSSDMHTICCRSLCLPWFFFVQTRSYNSWMCVGDMKLVLGTFS